MQQPEYFVITSAQWGDVCNAFMLLCALTVFLSVNWVGWFDRIEWMWMRVRRRRRLRAIRERKAMQS